MEPALVGFITDVEGNFDYWRRSVALSHVVCFDSHAQLQFARPDYADVFVYGADVFDKGPGDIRIARALIRFKEANPDRVFLLVGNRDVNKLRLPAELAEDEIDVPHPVPAYPRAPPQVSLRAFLERIAEAQGSTVEAVNTKANRLRWILDCTMTAKGCFEFRRQELALLQASDEGDNPTIGDDEVTGSFLDSVLRDDGFVWRYLQLGQVALLTGDTLFVHGGVPDGAPGWLPSLDMRYLSPGPDDVCGGFELPKCHALGEWVNTMNDFYQTGLRDFRAQMTWREGRRRGGEALLCLTSTPACFGRSVMVESLLQAGTPVPVSPSVKQYLVAGGVRRVVCGHKPCGDSPFVIRRPGLEFVHCDTTYSDQSAKDGRGEAVAAVEIGCDEGGGTALHLYGVLRDGRSYNVKLPAPGGGCAAATPQASVSAEGGGAPNGVHIDLFVGRRLRDGRWVKVVLADGGYHVAASKPGDRHVSYDTVDHAFVAAFVEPLE